MSRRACTAVLLFCAAHVGGAAAGAQAAADGAAHGLSALAAPLPDDQEIQLASTAAPPEISSRASIYEVRNGHRVQLRSGSNGCSCMVSRDRHAGSQYPMCFDIEATKTLLQRELLQNELRARGENEADVNRHTADAYRSGTLRLPARMAVAYMMSHQQVLFSAPEEAGVRVGAWFPHIMISAPGLTPEVLGLTHPSSVEAFSVDLDSDAHPQLIVKLQRWSDGTPVTLVAPPRG